MSITHFSSTQSECRTVPDHSLRTVSKKEVMVLLRRLEMFIKYAGFIGPYLSSNFSGLLWENVALQLHFGKQM